MFGGDEVGAIVLDVGSSHVKGGFAGEDNPKAYFPTPCGVHFPDVDAVTAGMTDSTSSSSDSAAADLAHAAAMLRARRFVLGQDALPPTAGLEVMAPVQHGLIMDWDAVEAIWRYTIERRLRSDPREHPVLLSEPVYNTQARREKTAEVMFESLGVPALYLAKDPVLSAFAQGKGTAMVVSSGSGATCVTPVVDGHALYRSAKATKIAGDSMDALVERLVLAPKGIADVPAQYEWTRRTTADGRFAVSRNSAAVGAATPSFRAFHQQMIVRELKESVCRCHDQAFDTQLYARIPARPFLLPDGLAIDVGVERMVVGEALFNPALGLGAEVVDDLEPNFKWEGLHKMLLHTMDACDVDLRKDMYSSIVLAGGNTLLRDVHVRLQKEVNALLPVGLRCKVSVPAVMVERKFAAWVGGSVMATLGTFQQLWFSKEEYEECGASLLLRKCP